MEKTLQQRKEKLGMLITLFCEEIKSGRLVDYYEAEIKNGSKTESFGHALYEFCSYKVKV